MSGEIVVPETPNWLNDLEAKRERRLKARLGHEAGAGAPCLKCGDKCPGLDLHFWRKACKICRCPKEEHDVPDDDIYGWAQFQLLGSKPNKIKTKIVLPGKNDEVELEWAPKGHKETIDKYLKTLPPEALPVKGSQAAQERKQLLQKQIPIHDIDPTLCHELNEEEVTKMEEYIAHIKKSSVGVGQIVNLSNIIKANLHNISPQEAHIIASRYSKGVPFSEIIKLQAGLAQNLENLTIGNPKNIKNQSTLPSLQPNKVPSKIAEENTQSVLPAAQFKDITYPWYTDSSPSKGQLNPQYAESFKSQQLGNRNPQRPGQGPDYSIDEKLLQGTNFDPSKTPSQFLGYRKPGYRPGQYGGQHPHQGQPNEEVAGYDISGGDTSKLLKSGPMEGGRESLQSSSVPYGKMFYEGVRNVKPNFSQDVHYPEHSDQYGFENPYFSQNRQGQKKLSGYSPAKYDPRSETQYPKIPKSVKDMMYSTYDPTKGPIPQDQSKNTHMDPKILDYGPDRTIDTYKHDPSVIRDESSSLPEKNDPTNLAKSTHNKPPHSDKLGSQHLKGLPKYDPVTGEYIPEGHRLPEPGTKFYKDHPYPYNYDNPNEFKFDPITGQPIPEVPKDYQHPYGYNSSQPNLYGLPKLDPVTGQLAPDLGHPESLKNVSSPQFDPITGKYIQDCRYPEPGRDRSQYSYGSDSSGKPRHQGLPTDVPATGKYIPQDHRFPKPERDDSRGNSGEELPKFDPITGKYISEDHRYSEAVMAVPRGKLFPHGSNSISHGKDVFDPKTGKYIGEDGYPVSANRFDPNSTSSAKPDRLESHENKHPHVEQPYFSPGRTRKPLSALQPGHITLTEDYLEPHMVNIGAIQDINPDIRAAIAELNPGFDRESFYSDPEYSPESIKEILNNIKLPDCHHCKKAFEEFEFAVTIDRATILFHAHCFKCAGCNQSLADNIYFYYKETDNVYCGRDYAKIKGYPRCSACDELIFTKEYCLAENSTFHLKHFCCFQCDIPLAGQDYTLEDEKPYCLPCYESSKAARCSTCEKVIKPDEIGCNLNGVHFHAEDRCFRCIVCSVPLMGKKLLLRNEKLYCSHDCFNTGKK